MTPQNRWAPGTRPEYDEAGWNHFHRHFVPQLRTNQRNADWPVCGLINKLEQFADTIKAKGWEAPRQTARQDDMIVVGWDDGSSIAITIDLPPQWIAPPDITYMGDPTVSI